MSHDDDDDDYDYKTKHKNESTSNIFDLPEIAVHESSPSQTLQTLQSNNRDSLTVLPCKSARNKTQTKCNKSTGQRCLNQQLKLKTVVHQLKQKLNYFDTHIIVLTGTRVAHLQLQSRQPYNLHPRTNNNPMYLVHIVSLLSYFSWVDNTRIVQTTLHTTSFC